MSDKSIELKNNRMSSAPVWKLIISLGIPTMISQLVTTIYNMADTYFVSTLGISASGATGVVFALMTIIQAFGFMFGHGSGSNISRLLGAGKTEKARLYSSTAFYSGTVFGIILLTLGLIFKEPLLYMLGSTDSILPYAADYAFFILIGAPALITSLILSVIVRYEGRAIFAMAGMGIGAVLNIFGDYLFVSVMGLGISGAGLSTCISQYVSLFVLLLPFIKKQTQSSLNPRYITLSRDILLRIFAVGAPSLIRQSLNSLSALALNHTASALGKDAAVAAMSIVARITNFMYCIVLGIGQGFQPVSGFNYGSGRYSRVKKAFTFTVVFNISLMIIIGAVGYFNAEFLVSLFRNDTEVLEIAVFSLQMQCLALPFLAFTIGENMLLQSTGKAFPAMWSAAFRSGLFYIPIILIGSALFGIPGIQLAQPLADVIACLACIPFIIKFMKELPPDAVS